MLECENPFFDASRPNQDAHLKDVEDDGAPEAKHGSPPPPSETAVTVGASLRPDTRSVTLGCDDRSMDEEAEGVCDRQMTIGAEDALPRGASEC